MNLDKTNKQGFPDNGNSILPFSHHIDEFARFKAQLYSTIRCFANNMQMILNNISVKYSIFILQFNHYLNFLI